MNTTRVSVADIAAAARISPQAVKKNASKYRWPYVEEATRGGRRRWYDITYLPAAVQAALAEKIVSAAPPALSIFPPPSAMSGRASFSSMRGVPEAPAGSPQPESGWSPDPRSESLGAIYEAKSEKQKARARAALEAVMQYQDLAGRGFKLEAAANAVTAARGISAATLSRQLAKVKGQPRDLWLFLLLPSHAGRTARADMSAEAWEILKGDYLGKPARSARACVERLREAAVAGRTGWTLPSDRTMERRLEQLPRDVKVLARKGREALMKLYPAQQRVKADLAALDIVNGDGYKHKKIWVLFEDGSIGRACTWFWQDVYSSKILAWRTDQSEHTELVRLSFGDLVERFGIPRAVLQDNTRAAANKTMSGGVRHRFRFKVKAEEPDGVFKNLGIERVMWATPAHGQAKPVERVFGIGGISEYVDMAPDLAPHSDENEKYNGKTRPVPIRQLEEVIAREVAAMNARGGRRGAMHKGRSWDEVFAESYAVSVIRRATDEQRRLWLLCTEPVKVQRDATITLDAGRMVGEHRANRYWSRELVDYAGRMVAARFDPKRLHEGVHLYTADGRYIAFGDCVDPAGFDDQNAARDQTRDRNRFIRSTKTALAAERRMTARQAGATLHAARTAGSIAGSTIPAPKVVQATFRDPLERPHVQPTPLSASDQVELERIALELAKPMPVNVLELQSDAAKHDHWLALDARRRGGELLADQEEQFWVHWQTQEFFIDMQAAEADFQRQLAERQMRA